MRIIGITGGIGSGKSTVSSILRSLGAKIIDADIVARRVVSKGEKALAEIVDNFGAEILDNEGELDRKKLAAIVFTNPDKLKLLNSITHKYIAQDIINQIKKEKEARDYETIVLDAPLLYEEGFVDMVDEVWVVVSDKETRIRRIMERNGLSYEESVNRINSQATEHEYINIADKIIENNSDIIDLEKSVVKLYYKKDI